MFQEESRIQLCYINTADELKNLRTDEVTQTSTTARAGRWRMERGKQPPGAERRECAQTVYAPFENTENFEKLEQQINAFSNIVLFVI